MVAIKADKDDIFNTLATNNQVPATAKPIGKDKPNITPSIVATPFPPLKPKNPGNKCPITAANPPRTITNCTPPTPVARSKGNKPVNVLESEYGESKSTIYGCTKKYSEIEVGPDKHITVAEYKKLQKKITQLEIENDIFIKATTILANSFRFKTASSPT